MWTAACTSANGNPRSSKWDASHRRPRGKIHRTARPGPSIAELDGEESHVEDAHHGPIQTESSVHQRRHGVHCYRDPRAGGVQGGRDGNAGRCGNPPDVLQAALRDIKAAGPACFGVNFIARFSGIEHIEVAEQPSLDPKPDPEHRP